MIFYNNDIYEVGSYGNMRRKGVVWATSFLGCDKLPSEYDFGFISKVLRILPSKLLIYGKHDKTAEKQLSNMGIDYRVYTDMHRLTKGGGVNG